MLTGARARKLAESHAQTHIYAEVQIMMLCRSTYTDNIVRAFMNVFADITGVRISMCLYITTKVSGVHGVMYMVNTTVNTVINGIKNVYDEYDRY